jgi:hypothetical protein
LFVFNSSFVEDQAAALAGRAKDARDLYRRVLARDPDAQELDLALSYLRDSSLPQLAQALLATNEFIFWP